MSYYHYSNYYGGYNNDFAAKSSMDTNRDGRVTRDDFVQSAYYHNGGYVTNQDMNAINNTFNRYDYNHDGRLDGYEATRAYDSANRGY